MLVRDGNCPLRRAALSFAALARETVVQAILVLLGGLSGGWVKPLGVTGRLIQL